jgi:hypothetical protein
MLAEAGSTGRTFSGAAPTITPFSLALSATCKLHKEFDQMEYDKYL